MLKRKYLKGKITDYSKRKGWFFGSFADEELLRSDLVEIAWQDITGKKTDLLKDWHYHKKSIEINIVLSGAVRLIIDGEKMIAKEGEFWVIWPHSVVGGVEAIGNTKLIVIRAPSLPEDKFTKAQ